MARNAREGRSGPKFTKKKRKFSKAVMIRDECTQQGSNTILYPGERSNDAESLEFCMDGNTDDATSFVQQTTLLD
ncbi:hypothetical protein KIN20_037538 [Parelaphostrongylus tenuis]|uniref:Uncharacterized protein n=1 Tax=Parelaphostrongylus tenuis TaxID=148309 RepID=A0AAD5RE34_PARTN|nr:hypothetical protein KIN20_037538 [Parelaphostrongylus tenuis]